MLNDEDLLPELLLKNAVPHANIKINQILDESRNEAMENPNVSLDGPKDNGKEDDGCLPVLAKAKDEMDFKSNFITQRAPEKKTKRSVNIKKNGSKNGKPKDGLKVAILLLSKEKCRSLFADKGDVNMQKETFALCHNAFFCGDCFGPLRSNGLSSNTLRLVCKTKECRRSTSYTKALEETRRLIIKLRPCMDPKQHLDISKIPKDTNSKEETTDFVDMQTGMDADTAMNPDGDESPDMDLDLDPEIRLDTSIEKLNNKPYPNQATKIVEKVNEEFPGDFNTLMDLFKTLKSRQDEDRTKIQILQNQREADKARILALERSIMELQGSKTMAPKSHKTVKSFAEIAAECPKQQTTEAKDKSNKNSFEVLGKRTASWKQSRMINGEDLEKILLGIPRKAGAISAVYTAGIKAMPVGKLKGILKTQCGIHLRNVPNIDFIGKSLTEFHVYSDYVDEFKKLITSKIPSMSFVDADPLCPSMFKDEAILDKVTEAARRYARRLEKRIVASPSMSHKRFLKSELERAKAQIQGKSVEATIPEEHLKQGEECVLDKLEDPTERKTINQQ